MVTPKLLPPAEVFLFKFFIRMYSLYGGFIVTILIRLILYIGYITSIVSSPQSSSLST
jgi:hypothetical protein